jgi:hypothetical protein
MMAGDAAFTVATRSARPGLRAALVMATAVRVARGRAAEKVADGQCCRGREYHRRDRPRLGFVERPPQLRDDEHHRDDEQHAAGAPDRGLEARSERFGEVA